MPAQLLGAHTSASGGVNNAVDEGERLGCTAIQVFTSSPRQWATKAVTEGMVELYKRSLAKSHIEVVVSHDSYLVNLSDPLGEVREKSLNSLTNEILRCSLYGIPYVVSHMGSSKAFKTEAEALISVAQSAKQILDSTPDNVTLLMETTAGQGSSLNDHFEHLAILLERIDGGKRLGVCLDTCHVFVAGYDIRDEESYTKTFNEFDRLVGMDNLKVIHCNDSVKGFNSHVDRHANIGDGEIGIKAFELLVNDPRFERIPILLETDHDFHEKNLNTLRSLRH